jgi:hypothetical protein
MTYGKAGLLGAEARDARQPRSSRPAPSSATPPTSRRRWRAIGKADPQGVVMISGVRIVRRVHQGDARPATTLSS